MVTDKDGKVDYERTTALSNEVKQTLATRLRYFIIHHGHFVWLQHCLEALRMSRRAVLEAARAAAAQAERERRPALPAAGDAVREVEWA